MEQRGIFSNVNFNPTVNSYKKLQYLLPWWKKSRKQEVNLNTEFFVDKYLLGVSDDETNTQSKETPSTSQETSVISPYKRAKIAFSKYTVKVKSGMKKIKKKEEDIETLAIKFFFKPIKKEEYFEKLIKTERTETDWFHHYNCVLSNAFAFESSVGTQTAISWALCCLNAMPERIPNYQKRLELLVKLSFIWYNFTFELKLRYATIEEEVFKSFHVCNNSFQLLIGDCKIDGNDKKVLDIFLKLIKTALLSRIGTNRKAEVENSVKEFFEKYRDELYVPHILIGLYYYEIALVSYNNGNVAAIDRFEQAFHYINASCIEKNLKWKYLLNVIYDAIRCYTDLDIEAKNYNQELYEIMYFTMEQEQLSDKHLYTAFNIHIYLGLSYLAIVLNNGQAGEHFESIRSIMPYINFQSSQICLPMSNWVDLLHFNTFAYYVTAIYPHFVNSEDPSETELLYNFMYNCIEAQKFGYNFISIATFYLVSNQYYSKDPSHEIIVAEKIMNSIDHVRANPEVLTYYLFAKFIKGICFYRQNNRDEGRKLINEALNSPFTNANFFDIAMSIQKCIEEPIRCKELATNYILDNQVKKVAKAVVAVAGDQFREKFPSNQEYANSLMQVFSRFASVCRIKASETEV